MPRQSRCQTQMPDGINLDRRCFIGNVLMTITGARLGLIGSLTQQAACSGDRPRSEGDLPSLRGATEWLNGKPLTTEALRGQVVVVQFCTYSCINWLRTLPYVRAWSEKYGDQKLTVIGVHTPEFSFEKDAENVRGAVKERNIEYPVAMDNDQTIWNAFSNQYWPALYIADAKGKIRHHHFGEGEYVESERVIQRLLAEAGASRSDQTVVSVAARGVEAAADWVNLKTPETYVGARRTENFASPGGVRSDERRAYVVPARLSTNAWALAGDWTVKPEAAVMNGANGKIAYAFHARDLHLVMGPATRARPVRFRVLLDGRPPGDAHGTDVDAEGRGTATEQRLYQLIRQRGQIADHQFEIEFLDPGVEAFSFTFG